VGAPAPDELLGDKAYSSRANRTLLRSKRTRTVIPQRADEIGHRQRRGSAGGRPPTFDPLTYKRRNVVERSFNDHKHWRAIATRYDKTRLRVPRQRRAPRHHHLAARIGRRVLGDS
jgi:transposase